MNKHWSKVHKVVLLESSNMTFEHEIILVGTHKMLHAITIRDDQLQSKIMLSNYAWSVPDA